MKKLRKLVLKKDVITSLGKTEQANLKGGMSAGCSDGCLSAWGHTRIWNCSKADCTHDCGHCGDPTWTASGDCPTLRCVV